MTKMQLIAAVSEQENIPARRVKMILESIVKNIGDELDAGNHVTIAGFGRFEMRQRAAKTFRNPKTGERVPLEATQAPCFKAGKQLKRKLKCGE